MASTFQSLLKKAQSVDSIRDLGMKIKFKDIKLPRFGQLWATFECLQLGIRYFTFYRS